VTTAGYQRSWKQWLGGSVALWVISAVIAFAVHGGGVALLVNLPKPAVVGSPDGIVMLDLETDPSPGGAPPGEGGKTMPKDVDRELPVDPDTVDKEEKKEIDQQKVEPIPEPPPPEREAVVTLPPVAKPAPKPPKTRAPLPGSPSANLAPRPQVAGELGRAKTKYNQIIVAHINNHKGSPAYDREEGVVNLAFTLDRNGKVLSVRIMQGSGVGELDRWALDIIRRAQPFPNPPPDLVGLQFPFTVPIRYNHR
jgi:protein TonB